MVWTRIWLALDLSDPDSGPSFFRLGLQRSYKVCLIEPALPWLFSFSIDHCLLNRFVKKSEGG
jgi:hypothetical protein